MGRLVKLEKEPERRLGDLNAGTGKKGRLVRIDTEPQRRLGELGKSAAAPAAAEKPAPKSSLAGASRAVTDTGTGDAAAERGARRQRYERQLRDIQKQQHARQLGAKNTAGTEEIEETRRQTELRKRLATLDLIDKYGQRNREDTYGGYIKSQYDIGQLGQDQAHAWSAVMKNPTAANLEYAQHVDSMIEDYTQRNQQALDPTGNHLFYSEAAPEWLQKAGKWADETIGANVQYLPQAKEQFFASIVPAVLGLMAGEVTGGKLGYSLGTALYSASTMAGSAYQALRELGADHETAKRMATNEAFLSSLIEGADTFADLSLFGFGKAAGKLGANVGKSGLVQAAKQFGASGAGKALGFLGNIAQEGLEEGTQQAVSIANRERYLRGYDPAKENFFQQVGGLTGDAAKIFWNGLKRDDPNHQEIMESAKGGAQVAIGMGALGFGTGAVTNRVMGDITGLNDPRNAFLYEGQSQGMTDPRAQLVQETEPAARPVTEPVTGNVTEPVTAPVTAPVTEHVTENAPPVRQPVQEQTAQPVQQAQPKQAQDGEAILTALAGDMAREEARQSRARREQEAARREQEYLQAMQTQNRILEETEAQADAERYAMSAEVARKSGGGLLQDEYTDTLDRRDMTALDASARQLGVTVSFAGEINHGLAEGQITGRAITLQRDAESPLRQLYGHEISHRIRDLAPKEFERFVQAVKAADPDFSGKVSEMLALGRRADEQYSEASAIEDVAADYAGRLMEQPQTLETFIAKNQHNPTLLQRMGQVFRELAQRLKGKLTGQQRTQAENAAAALEKAYAAAVKAERKSAENDGTGARYSIGKTTDNKAFVEVEQDILSGVPEKDWVKTVKENLKQKFPDGITVGNNEIQIDGRSRQEMTFSRYMQWLYNNDPQLHADKLRATNNADEILFATTDWVNEGLNHPRKDRIADFARGNVLLRVGGNDYTANVVVGTKKNGSMALYDVLNLQPTSFTEKETDAAISTNPSPGAARSTASVSANSISETGQDVNPKYSLKRDAALEKDFASIREQLEAGKLTEEQADRLREEAVDRAAQRTPDFKALEQENAALRKRVERLQRQTKITERPVVREGDINRLANDLLKGYESRADRREIQKQLRALGDFIVQNGSEGAELTWDTAKERAMAIADQIVEQASVLNDSSAEDYREIRQYFRDTPLVISKEDSADIPDFADFKRSLRGRLRVRLGEGGNIDKVFSDMAARWPEFFNADATTHPADQLARMADVVEALRPAYENPYGGSMGYAKEAVANDILDGLLSQQVRQEAATFADRQARRLQEQRSRYLAILEKEKAKRREAVAAAKEHGKQALRLQTERRGQSQRREQIKRHIGELSARLLNPSDSKNIPEGLRQPIARALSMIDLDSKRTGDDRRQALQALRSAYLDIIRDGSSGVVVDPELLGDSTAGAEGLLEQLAAVRSVPLAEMNRAELETVWKVVRSLEHAVSTAGKTLASQKFETTKDWARAFASDASGRRSKSIILKGAFPRMQDMLDPRSFFDQYGASGLAVWRMLRNAQDSVTQKVQTVAEQVGAVIDADFARRVRRETHTFTTEEGKTLTLTTGQIMNLYNLMQREQAQEHLMKGGVIQPEVGTGRKKIARGTEAIRLTLNDLQRIVSVLDPQARMTAQTLQRLTTGQLADWGNEASLKAYGYRKFTEKNYWPIKSAAEELHSNVEKGESNTRSIKNIGMAKKVIPHANNALELGDALDVFARHTADMVEYSSWLLPMEDANRLFNFAFRDEKGNRTGKTIKGELNRVGGAGSTQYWQRLMEDIQNGIRVRADTNAERSVGRIVGNAKGAAVGANLRVVLQQPTAFLRANAVISPASLSKGLVKGVTGGNGWRKAVRWAGIARIKEVGGFDQGGFRTINQQLYGSTGFLDRISAAAGFGAEKADAVTWGALWNASEWETKRLHPALEAGSGAFYRRTAEIFTDLIEQSQVVDGVLQRSQIMRSGNAFNQMATAFMGEPLKTLNMLLRSLDKLRYETDGKKRSAARKQLGRTAAALVATSVANAAAQSLVDAARDDDDDKDYKKRFLKAFVGLDGDEKTAWQIAGAVLGLEGDEDQITDVLKALAGGTNLSENLNPIGWIPYTKEILSAMQGFEVSRADAAVVSDVVNAVTVTLDAAQGKGKKTLAYALRNLTASVATMLGVPAKALTRDLWAGIRTAAQETENWQLLYALSKAVYKPEQNKKRYMDLLYRAKKSDGKAYEAIRKDMLDHGWFEDTPEDEHHTLTMTPRETAEAYIDKQMENRRREDAVSGEEADEAYSSLMDAVKENPWYTQTRPETKNRVADAAQDLSQRNAAGEKLQDKLDENGVNAEDYLWYLIYLDKFDQPNKNGNYGTYTQEERKAAIDALKVDRQTSSGLWIFSGGSAKNNPYK